MNHKNQASSSPLKFGLGAGMTAILFVSALVVAWHSRHYQVIGEPMPNGKGGTMGYAEGYYLSLVLLSMTIGCFLIARRFWRERPGN